MKRGIIQLILGLSFNFGWTASLSFVILLASLAIRPVAAIESDALRQTIRLRGMPDDEVPVITSLALQPAGDLLATSGDDHAVRLWDLKTGQLTRTLRGHSDWVTSVSFYDNGTKLLTGSRDRRLLMWNLAHSRRPVPLGKHARPISSIRVHDATNRVAVVGFRAPLKVYALKSGRLLGTWKCACSDTRAIAFSPSGELFAAGGRNGKLRIWKFSTNTHIDLPGHARRVTSVVFASEDLLLSAGEDKTIRCWNTTTGVRQHTLSHDAGKVFAMAMIDGQRFAAATARNTIALFHLQDASPFALLNGHTGSVAALVARDNQLISGSFDTTVRIWAIRDEESQNQAATEPSVDPTVAEPTRAANVSARIDVTATTVE